MKAPLIRFRQALGQVVSRMEEKEFALPKDLKAAWPDSHLIKLLSNRFTANMGADYHAKTLTRQVFPQLGVRNDARMLDIGAGTDELMDEVIKGGYPNCRALDASEDIRNSYIGIHMNFRDYPIEEKYDVILFSLLLDCENPMDLLAKKIYLHLNKGGFLIFNDPTYFAFTFEWMLKGLGFVRIRLQGGEVMNLLSIWKKP
ncbi:methyltransferase domain-containing protein [Candidatus Margulisiibacteriota bacterium]